MQRFFTAAKVAYAGAAVASTAFMMVKIEERDREKEAEYKKQGIATKRVEKFVSGFLPYQRVEVIPSAESPKLK